MNCVVCHRSSDRVDIVNFSRSTICKPCQVAFYRYLNNLYTHLEFKYHEIKLSTQNSIMQQSSIQNSNTQKPRISLSKIQRLNLQIQQNLSPHSIIPNAWLNELIWEYLFNPQNCTRKNKFLPDKLCKLESLSNANYLASCQLCRFRRMIVGIKYLIKII